MKIKITDKPNETLYIYCRVSTTSQSEEGVSLDVQEERGLQVSKQLGLSPIVIKEQGSGLKPYIPHTDENGKKQGRPLFSEIMKSVSFGDVKHLWIDTDNRLTRHDVDEPFIKSKLKSNNVKLYVGIDGKVKDLDDFGTKLVDMIRVMVNQDQIQEQVEKSIRSKRKLFQEGCYMKGDPPFGYKLVEKKLELHEDNSEWVNKIYNWYDGGKSTWWIRNKLFQEQIEPPRFKTSGNMLFPSETIVNILHNKNYIGIDVYGDLVGECPSIVDKNIFYSVQKKFKMNKGQRTKMKREFLLRGLIKCPDGKPMSCLGVKKSRKNPLYSCGHRERKYKNRKSVDCSITRSVRMELMDEYVWGLLCDTLSHSHLIRENTKIELIGKQSKYTKRSFRNEIKKLYKEMEELDGNRLELEKRYYTNKIEKKRFDILINSIEETENDLMEKISQENMKLQSLDEKTKWIDWLDVHFKRIGELRKTEGLKQRKEIISHYIQDISVFNYDEETRQHTISFKFRFPLFKDNFEWLKNKDGSYKLDRYGRRRYNITDGKTEMTYPLTLQQSFNRNGLTMTGGIPITICMIGFIQDFLLFNLLGFLPTM